MHDIAVVAGTADVSVPIKVIDSTDASNETGYDHTTTGKSFWYQRQGQAVVTETTLVELATEAAAHADWGLRHMATGDGRLDLPDAACAIGTDGATWVKYGGHFDGMFVGGGVIKLTDPVASLFQSVVVGSTGNTTTTIHIPSWTYADDEPVNHLIGFYDSSEGEWFARIVRGWVNSTKLATVRALPAAPENAVDRVALLSGMAWNPSWDAEIESEVSDALVAADVPSDVGQIKAKTDQLAFTKANEVDANSKSINGATVTGDGNATPWDGA